MVIKRFLLKFNYTLRNQFGSKQAHLFGSNLAASTPRTRLSNGEVIKKEIHREWSSRSRGDLFSRRPRQRLQTATNRSLERQHYR